MDHTLITIYFREWIFRLRIKIPCTIFLTRTMDMSLWDFGTMQHTGETWNGKFRDIIYLPVG